MDSLTVHHTSIEVSDNVMDTIKWKLDSIKDKELPIESGIADYIALGISNLDKQISQMDHVAKEIADRKAVLKAQKIKVLEGAAEFMNEFGADKLQGVFCSSVTVTKFKKAVESEKQVFRLTCTRDEMEKHLYDAGLAVYDTVPTFKEAVPSRAKVNKRKVENVEVIEDE